MNTFETARLIRVKHCELLKMTDEQIEAEVELYTPKSSLMDFSDAVYNECHDSIDIGKTWRTSSRMERGATPYITYGAKSEKRAKMI